MEYGKELAVYAAERKDVCMKNDAIPGNLYQEYGVKRGLRDEQGRGVLAGLTNISAVISMKEVDGVRTACDGELWYRGYNVKNLVNAYGKTGHDLRLPRTCCFSENCPPRTV